jgi:eukaryotic-like serine/threonine-protein kinase
VKTIKLPSGTFEYDLAKPLGKRGGFGQVFVGKTAKGDGVAVKKLHVSAADTAHREMRIVDELKKRLFEYVIPFIDAGEDADSGEYFVIMPKAEKSLQALVDANGSLTTIDAAAILFQIAKGLSEVGDLVHRDMKPDNVLLHEGKWKIADFGIARFVQEVTASNTLKDCLSPFYAAPEQWRMERATHATDIYALGCIAFCLLVGKPPFGTNPSEEHQRAAIPEFKCDDSRLKGLITMMLRKLPETRPIPTRVQQLLKEIVEKPKIDDPSDSFSALAAVGAKLAQEKQRLEAEEQAERQRQVARNQMAKDAHEILSQNIERLWGKIHSHVEIAKRTNDSGQIVIQIGNAALLIDIRNRISPSNPNLQNAGWDLISAAEFTVYQGDGIQWGASLFYVKQKDHEEYRWAEIAFGQMGYSTINPARDIQQACSSLMRMSPMIVAYGPWFIDDEAEEKFHLRIVWLLTKAANKELKNPRSVPFQMWPPPL